MKRAGIHFSEQGNALKISRYNKRACKVEINSLRFLKLLWIWSCGCQELMQSAWDSQQQLDEYFDNVADMQMPEVLQIIHEHLCPSHPSYEQECIFLAYPESEKDQTVWFGAWRYYAEWQLTKSVRYIVINQGTPAPTCWMLITYARILKGEEEHIPDFMQQRAISWWMKKSHNARKIWLCRWRKAWGFLDGHLHPRGHFLAADVHKKAKIFL